MTFRTLPVFLFLTSAAGAQGTYYSSEQNFYYALNSGQTLNVTVNPDDYVDWDIRLYGPSGALITSTYNGTGVTEYLTYAASSSGTYRVNVRWYSGSGGYLYSASTGGSSGTYYTTTQEFTYSLGVGDRLDVRVQPDATANWNLRISYPPDYSASNTYDAGGAGVAESFSYTASVSGSGLRVTVFKWYGDTSTGGYTYSATVTRAPTASTTPSNYYTTEQNFYHSLSPGQRLSVTVDPDNYVDWDIYLYSPSGAYIASTYNGTGVTETLNYAVPSTGATGSYRVRVARYSGSGGYTYTASVTTTTTTPTPTTNPSGNGPFTASQSWSYALSSGQSIMAILSPTNDLALSWKMTVYGPSGSPVGSDPGIISGTARKFLLTAPVSGTYRIDVSPDAYWSSGAGYWFGAWTSAAAPPFTNGSTYSHLNDWTWTYSLASGQALNVSVSMDSNADWDLWLTDPYGNLVREAYAGGRGVTESISYTATTSGTYKVRIFLDKGWGGHTLSGGASATSSTTSPPPSSTTTQSILVGQSLLSQRFEWQSAYASRQDGTYGTYTVPLTAGVTYTIQTSAATGATTDTYLYLFLGGTMVGYDDDSNGNLASRITITPTTTGTYTIKLRAYSQGTYGSCTLSVN